MSDTQRRRIAESFDPGSGKFSCHVRRRMLSECLATETAFTKNNIFEAADCEEGAVCCCSGNVYVSDGGVNFCCIPGYQGCDAPTYDMTFAFTKGYGCYSTTAGTNTITCI